jgi:hypothetical protein
VPIPPTKRRPWYVRETWPAILALGLSVPAGAFATWAELAFPRINWVKVVAVGLLSASAILLGLAKLAQSRYKDAKDDDLDAPKNLRGCLHVIYRTIAGAKGVGDPPEGWLRLTVHRVDGDMLEQSVDYVGSRDGGVGRRFRIQAGLIGKAARERPIQPRVFHRLRAMTHEEWLNYLVLELAMTYDDAKVTRPGRYSFMCVPISDSKGETVRAVLFADASDDAFFDEDTKALVVNGCEGLADWTDEHYYRGAGS